MDGAGNAATENALSMLLSLNRPDPLAVGWPSPFMLVHYPLFVTNVKVLCKKDPSRSRGQSSIAATISSLRWTYETEGLRGLYKGGHLHLLHQASRDLLRFGSDRLLRIAEKRWPRSNAQKPWYKSRLACKYLIDALCYPILLASTRIIVLGRDDDWSSLDHFRLWLREEGLWTLFGGLTASLVSTALDEAMDLLVSTFIDQCSAGSDVDLADRLLLKTSGSSVVSVITAPINYVGVVQRCQSRLPGLLLPVPLWETFWNLPWRGSLYQMVMFSGILMLNIRLTQWKLQLKAEEAEYEEDE